MWWHRAETRFRLSAKRTSPFKSAGASVQSTTGSRSVRISGSNAGYTMFRGSVKSTGYPLRSPVFPSLPLPTSPCAITFQLDSTCTLAVKGWRWLAAWTMGDCFWNVMAHVQKPDFVFRRKGRVPLYRQRLQFIRQLAAEMCASAVVMLDTPYSEVVWRVLATHSVHQFSLHFHCRASPCAIIFQLGCTRMGCVYCRKNF